MTPAQAAAQPSDQICTAIYTVYLRPEYTTHGNDLGMLQPHGKNTSGYGTLFEANWAQSGVNLSTIGADYTNWPFPTDPNKQANAKAQFSVTALTEPTGTPIGFKQEKMHMYYSVCVQIRNVGNRWIEIMVRFFFVSTANLQGSNASAGPQDLRARLEAG